MSQSHCYSQFGTNGHNSHTCSPAGDDSSSTGGEVYGEIMLFGVRVKVDPMRKSVSMNNLSQYEQPAKFESSNKNLDVAAVAVAADTGYASADDAGRHQSNGIRERKRGIPWSEEEHKLFLLGLQKVGKGDWKGISRNFVKTRTPTQVASHAQKYFLRRSNLNRRRRRSSLFDITTDLVAAIPTEEQQVHGDNNGHSASQTPMPSLQHISPLSGFPMATFPVIAGPVLPPLQIKNHTETITFNNGDQVHDGSTPPVTPMPVLPAPNPSTMAGLNSNQKCEIDPLSLSLNLSLSYDQNQPPESHTYAFQIMSGLNNGDGIISVA